MFRYSSRVKKESNFRRYAIIQTPNICRLPFCQKLWPLHLQKFQDSLSGRERTLSSWANKNNANRNRSTAVKLENVCVSLFMPKEGKKHTNKCREVCMMKLETWLYMFQGKY
ncbi:hypothetical protein CEXT_65261 [Caerostris extrusa]|uniref:Uncharacterized protein n=1 Tax=Caerostris extrusa TaxID=172846 RepID=A0AAV4UVG1_CAEEX|nr:hypothetical protein CEXT_65261 [Caerostris extrusa]